MLDGPSDCNPQNKITELNFYRITKGTIKATFFQFENFMLRSSGQCWKVSRKFLHDIFLFSITHCKKWFVFHLINTLGFCLNRKKLISYLVESFCFVMKLILQGSQRRIQNFSEWNIDKVFIKIHQKLLTL